LSGESTSVSTTTVMIGKTKVIYQRDPTTKMTFHDDEAHLTSPFGSGDWEKVPQREDHDEL